MKLHRLSSWLPRSFVPLLVGLAFLPALHFGYVWDDHSLFLNTPDLRAPDLIWHALWQPVLRGSTYLRPLVLASFAVEFLTLGTSPAWAHGINLLIHLANVAMVMALAHHFVRDTSRPTLKVVLAGLLYGLHPALIEPVAWAAGRFDLMVTFFSLAALLAAVKLAGWRRMLTVSLCFFLAALSKEMAATLPLLVFLVLLASRDRDIPWREMPRHIWRQDAAMYALLLLTGIVYLIIRKITMPGFVHIDTGVESDFHHDIGHIAFVGQTLIFYVKMSLWPFAHLNPMHPFSPAQMTVADHWTGLGALALAVLASVTALWRRSTPGILVVAWLVALLPVLNILPLTIVGDIGEERFLTLPLAFLVLGFMRLPAPRFFSTYATLPYLVTLVALAWLAFSVATVRITLPLWRNDYLLWNWALIGNPRSNMVRYNHALTSISFGHLRQAEDFIQNWEDKQNDPPGPYSSHGPIIHYLKGVLAIKLGHYQTAEQEFRASLSGLKKFSDIPELDIVTLFANTCSNLAEAEIQLSQFSKALASSSVALGVKPNWQPALAAKALALYGLDQVKQGNETFDQLIRYYSVSDKNAAIALRAKFIEQLCARRPIITPNLCGYWNKSGARLQ